MIDLKQVTQDKTQIRSDRFEASSLQKELRTQWAGHSLLFFESIDSTNLQARKEAEKNAPHGTLLAADMQTNGQGRRGRGWDSPAGTNVYFSLILRPEVAIDRAPMLTLVMACAAAKGLERTMQESAPAAWLAEHISRTEAADGTGRKRANNLTGIKWPNDLVINGKKICGILTEMSADKNGIRYVIIGCGINVGKQEFAPEIASKATTVEAECGFSIDRSRLVANILEAFEEAYEVFLQTQDLSGLKEMYQGLLVNKDREVCVLDPQGEYQGTARGITDTGELLVELPNGKVQEVYAGEVSVRGIYGYV